MNMKRRDLFKSAVALTAGMAGFGALKPLYAMDDFEAKGPEMPDIPVTKVNDRCYYFMATDGEPSPENQGFFSNPGFVITSKGVVVMDTGGTVQIGEMMIRQIKKITDKPVVAIFNSHIHGDHWFGNQAFVAEYPEVKIYGHPNIMRDIKDGVGQFWLDFMHRYTANASAGTSITPPNLEVNGGDVIKVGDRSFKVHYFGKVHSDSDIAIEVVEDNVMYAGDMAMRRVANMADGSFVGSIKAMEEFEKMTHIKTYIPGHGHHDDISLMTDQKTFYEIIYNTVEEYYDDGLTDFEIKPKIEEHPFMKDVASKWPSYNSTLGRFVSTAYQEFEANLF